MKHLYAFLLCISALLCSTSLLSQGGGFTYQAVVRNSSNDLIANSEVQIEISILRGNMSGPVEYMETLTKMTNEAGLVALEVGSMMPASFDAIPWEEDDFYLKQRINPDPMNMPGNYTIESTTKLLSVPYAKYAEKAGRASIADAVVDNGSGMDAFRMPVGSVIPFAGDIAPDGWFICDGRLLDQTQYADLHTVIGTTYGGAGSDFRIPDLRGRHPMGKGNGTFANLNSSGGQEEQTLTEDELPVHAHGIDDVSTDSQGDHVHKTVGAAGGTYGSIRQSLSPGDADPNSIAYLLVFDGQTPTLGNTSSEGAHSHTINGKSTEDTGNGDPFSILDPYIVLNYIIKY